MSCVEFVADVINVSIIHKAFENVLASKELTKDQKIELIVQSLKGIKAGNDKLIAPSFKFTDTSTTSAKFMDFLLSNPNDWKNVGIIGSIKDDVTKDEYISERLSYQRLSNSHFEQIENSIENNTKPKGPELEVEKIKVKKERKHTLLQDVLYTSGFVRETGHINLEQIRSKERLRAAFAFYISKKHNISLKYIQAVLNEKQPLNIEQYRALSRECLDFKEKYFQEALKIKETRQKLAEERALFIAEKKAAREQSIEDSDSDVEGDVENAHVESAIVDNRKLSDFEDKKSDMDHLVEIFSNQLGVRPKEVKKALLSQKLISKNVKLESLTDRQLEKIFIGIRDLKADKLIKETISDFVYRKYEKYENVLNHIQTLEAEFALAVKKAEPLPYNRKGPAEQRAKPDLNKLSLNAYTQVLETEKEILKGKPTNKENFVEIDKKRSLNYLQKEITNAKRLNNISNKILLASAATVILFPISVILLAVGLIIKRASKVNGEYYGDWHKRIQLIHQKEGRNTAVNFKTNIRNPNHRPWIRYFVNGEWREDPLYLRGYDEHGDQDWSCKVKLQKGMKYRFFIGPNDDAHMDPMNELYAWENAPEREAADQLHFDTINGESKLDASNFHWLTPAEVTLRTPRYVNPYRPLNPTRPWIQYGTNGNEWVKAPLFETVPGSNVWKTGIAIGQDVEYKFFMGPEDINEPLSEENTYANEYIVNDEHYGRNGNHFRYTQGDGCLNYKQIEKTFELPETYIEHWENVPRISPAEAKVKIEAEIPKDSRPWIRYSKNGEWRDIPLLGAGNGEWAAGVPIEIGSEVIYKYFLGPKQVPAAITGILPNESILKWEAFEGNHHGRISSDNGLEYDKIERRFKLPVKIINNWA